MSISECEAFEEFEYAGNDGEMVISAIYAPRVLGWLSQHNLGLSRKKRFLMCGRTVLLKKSRQIINFRWIDIREARF
jgi:hypothetical protein